MRKCAQPDKEKRSGAESAVNPFIDQRFNGCHGAAVIGGSLTAIWTECSRI